MTCNVKTLEQQLLVFLNYMHTLYKKPQCLFLKLIFFNIVNYKRLA